MILTPGSTHLGFYKVGNARFVSKVLAQNESLRTNAPIEWDFNDEVFDRYDWTKEPEPGVSIDEYYRRRAQQLRDKYEYIVLMYSGGPDSQTVLDSFLSNNIRLDEIVNVNSYDRTQQVEGTTHNADFFYNVKPTVENILKQYGNMLKITILDEIDITKKVFKDAKAKSDFYEMLFNGISFPSGWLFRSVWIKYVPHLWSKFLEGKKICILYGYDKPSLDVENGKYFSTNYDVWLLDSEIMTSADPDLKNSDLVETFYHTPDFPELTIKQSHLVKQFLERPDVTQDYFESVEQYTSIGHRPPFNCKSKRHRGSLKYQYFHKVIYPSWKPNVATPKLFFTGTRMEDCWWVYGMDTDIQKIWLQGLFKHHQNFNFLSKQNDKITRSSPLPFVRSKKRFLEL